MNLKGVRLGRAEDLSPKERKDNGLPDKGLILIEIRDPPEPKMKIISIETGISDYLLSLGPFNDIPITD